MENRTIDALFFPDIHCPQYRLMGEDLLNVPHVEPKCLLQEYWYGEYGDTDKDYKNCDERDHNTCPVYLAHIKKG